MKKLLFQILAICITNGLTAQTTLNHIYKSGEDGYSCFRIPALVTTLKGKLLAFAEARRNNCGDAGDIDLVVKTSIDGGKTWGPIQMVWNDSTNTCGNPSPIVDARTGHIVLLSTWNLGTDHEKDIINQISKDSRRVFALYSSDDGKTWSAPKEITSTVKLPGWTWYATGPGSAIQLTKGKHKGRMLVACDHIEAASKKYFSHSVYSDDAGVTWALGGTTPSDSVNECTMAELKNGDIMLNMRNYSKVRSRQVSVSKDAGITWSALRADTVLIEPVCQGSLVTYTYKGRKPALLFSNPASQKSRVAMTVRVSYNQGKTWPLFKLLYAGPSAYSNVGVLPDGKIACLYEAGYEKAYEGIVFDIIDWTDLEKRNP